MEILIHPVGKIENEAVENHRFSGDQTNGLTVLLMLKNSLREIFNAECHISKGIMKIPEESYNPSRNQYYSTGILSSMMNTMKIDSNHLIGVTEVDLYVPGLNFIFGEAECPGNFAIISLYRLKHPDRELFLKRVLIEAVHELGHTFGLPHCQNHLCVMYFSNNIVETDIKGPEFCKECLNRLSYLK